MSSQKYASPLSIDILPSRSLSVLLVAMHVGAAGLIGVTSLSIMVKSTLLLLVVASIFTIAIRLHWIVAQPPFTKLTSSFNKVVWDENDQWRLIGKDGQHVDAQLLPTSYVHRYLVTVNLRVPGQPWYKRHVSLVFVPDNINKEVFRRLRIRLRWYSTPFPDNSAVLK